MAGLRTPSRTARTTASVRLSASSFSMIREMWVFTVSTPMPSRRAIRLFGRP